MYLYGYVIPVPEDRKDDYRAWSELSAGILKDYGCLEIVQGWEDDVPDGQVTDFRRAVAALPGERIVFCWQVWPDRQTLDDAQPRLMEDPRLSAEPPFDASRLIMGGFTPLHTFGRADVKSAPEA